MKPTFTGVSLSDSSAAAQNVVQNANTFIQIISNIKVAFNGASGSYGSNITGYRAEIVGKNQTTDFNGGTLGIMNYNGTFTVRASVSDSRGRWSDTRDVTVTVLEYFAPSLKIDVNRVGETSSSLEIIRNARIAPLIVNGAQKNTMKLTFKVSPYGKDDYTTDTGPASGEWLSVSSLVNSPANLAGIYAANRSWKVLAVLEDKFTSTSFKEPVPVESVALSYDQSGLGVGKIREFGALDVAGDIYANNSQIQQYQLTSNNGAPKWVDKNANLIDQPGQYYLDPSVPGNPNGQWGYLFHYSNYGKNDDGFKEAIQTFWGNNGQLFFRHHRWSMIIDDWEPWVDYTPKKTSVVKREIQIGWGVRANLVRESNVVTLSLERGIYSLPPYEYAPLAEKIPNGFKPCVQTHMVVNKNASNGHYGCAVWHLETNGDIRFSNPNTDTVDGNAVYTGTVTYITEDEYPH